MDKKIIKKGQLLIAEPSIIGDFSFNRSIILLTEHAQEGSVGLILNKPFDFTLSELIPNVNASFKVYNGGPVAQDNLYFIHKIPQLITNSIEVSVGIYWGGDFSEITSLLSTGIIKDTDIRFFLGYSGWSPMQLEYELQNNTWLLTDNIYKSEIISKKPETFWKEKMLELGDDYKIWANAPENPDYN